MKRRTKIAAAAFLYSMLPAVAFSQVTWLPYISDETGGFAYCASTTEAVAGVRCSGSYCDNVGIRCQTLPTNITVTGNHHSDTFSEEGYYGTNSTTGWYQSDSDNSHVCNWGKESPGIVTGMRCSGSYCDNITLECATPRALVNGTVERVRFTGCYWTGYYSEEDPWVSWDPSQEKYIAGVQCSGSYCDDKRYYICHMEPILNSCRDRCDGQAPDGCYCDDVCEFYGDCCPDYALECGGAASL